MPKSVLYLVHDLSDHAVARRIKMFLEIECRVSILGFSREEKEICTIEGLEPYNLGITKNAHLTRRIVSVFIACCQMGRWKNLFKESDFIVARNLEMLLLAFWGKLRFRQQYIIIFECLDIHRLLVEGGLGGKLIRYIEAFLLRHVDFVVTSSQSFIDNHFAAFNLASNKIIIIENKILESEARTYAGKSPITELREYPLVGRRPWKIGWYGALRCKKSFKLLVDLANSCDGAVEIHLSGKPALDQIPDFMEVVENSEHVIYKGPYNRAIELKEMYSEVHFYWAIDFYEEGSNSSWLLPNRIYEGSLFGSVALALTDVATGQWLAQFGAGVLLEAPTDVLLSHWFLNLDDDTYQKYRASTKRIPLAAIVQSRADSHLLLRRLFG